MNFNEKLNEYINELDCTAKELSKVSGLSPATISRYRNGERMPEIDSEAFGQLCDGIAILFRKKSDGEAKLLKSDVERSFFTCADIVATSKENLRQKLNILISVLNINITNLSVKILAIFILFCAILSYAAETAHFVRFSLTLRRFGCKISPNNLEVHYGSVSAEGIHEP